MMDLERLLFLDLETGGFDPKFCPIIEIGSLRRDQVTGEGYAHSSMVLHYSEEWWAHLQFTNPGAYAMHVKSGLREDSIKSAFDQADLASYLEDLGAKNILSGFSNHFDRLFLHEYAPAWLARQHHRQMDVSTFREMGKRYGSPLDAEGLSKNPKHRAIDDCEAARITFNEVVDRYYLNRHPARVSVTPPIARVPCPGCTELESCEGQPHACGGFVRVAPRAPTGLL